MGSFRISRSTSIAADPALVHRLVNDVREWAAWSPWEGCDPHLERTYSGAEQGTGAHYAWAGGRRGRGSIEITASTPERVDVHLEVRGSRRPAGDVTFLLAAAREGTDVTWSMAGEQTGWRGLVARVVPTSRLVGKDLDAGLARLKAAAEAEA